MYQISTSDFKNIYRESEMLEATDRSARAEDGRVGKEPKFINFFRAKLNVSLQ